MASQNKKQGMAGRKSTSILLIFIAGFFFFSERLIAQTEPEDQLSNDQKTDSFVMKNDGQLHLSGCPVQTQCPDFLWVNGYNFLVQSPHTIDSNAEKEFSRQIDDISLRKDTGRMQLDFALGISYSHFIISSVFLQSTGIFTRIENNDQFLNSVDIKPSIMITDRIALNFIYSYIPQQDNFSESGVLDFEVQQTIVTNVNRFSGQALSVSGSYAVPINDWIRVSAETGFTNMRLNTEEEVRYNPSNPDLRNYRVVRLLMSKKRVTYTNPFVGLSTEFQLRNLRLSLGYQHHIYQFDEVSSYNFSVSLGARFRDLF